MRDGVIIGNVELCFGEDVNSFLKKWGRLGCKG